MAATILRPWRALPAHVVTQEQVKAYMGPVFGLDARRLQLMLSVVENSRVDERRLVFPVDYVVEPRPLSQVNREYQEQATLLGREAAAGALCQAGIRADEIDLLITVSCTGIMIPSLDAFLVNDLGMRRDTVRLPVTELGCAAGAAALARAADYVRAWPESNVLVVAVELPSLTFQRNDISPAHLISCTLFGDGAAAVVVTGQDRRGAKVLATQSHLFPDTYDAMGFDLRDSGFHIVLSKNVPSLIRDNIGELTTSFLASHGMTLEDLDFFWLHPGGQKVMAAMEQELGVDGERTRASWEVLAKHGNLSSVTVLYIMEEALRQSEPTAGARGLMAAFGPGFSAEMLLLEWG